MQYHSQEFKAIAEQAAAYARPFILQTIRDLSADFTAKFPSIKNVNTRHGNCTLFLNNHNYVSLPKTDDGSNYRQPFTLFILDIAKNGFRAEICLQPELLVDGIPIAEAIEQQQKTYVVLRSTGCGYDYAREVLYAGPDYHTAKHIVLTDHREKDTDADTRQDLEHWYGGRCTEVEEYEPQDFTH